MNDGDDAIEGLMNQESTFVHSAKSVITLWILIASDYEEG